MAPFPENHEQPQAGTIMRKLLLLAALLASLTAHAVPASEESIDKLLAGSRAESLLDSVYSSMEGVLRNAMAQATQGKTLSAEQQRVLDAVPAKFVVVMKQELSWQKLKPLYVQIYRESFEQEEVDGLVAFYASPAGKAMLDKMPTVMQKSMAITQPLMQSLIPKMKSAMEEAMSEARLSK
jgi:hypothetical protein